MTDRQRHHKRVVMKVVSGVQPGRYWMQCHKASSDRPSSSSAALKITKTARIVEKVILLRDKLLTIP